MNKTAASFSRTDTAYAPFFYIYIILHTEVNYSFHVIFRSLLYAVCISATLPSIRPYLHGKYHLLSRPSTYVTHWLLTACSYFLIHLYIIPFMTLTVVDVHY